MPIKSSIPVQNWVNIWKVFELNTILGKKGSSGRAARPLDGEASQDHLVNTPSQELWPWPTQYFKRWAEDHKLQVWHSLLFCVVQWCTEPGGCTLVQRRLLRWRESPLLSFQAGLQFQPAWLVLFLKQIQLYQDCMFSDHSKKRPVFIVLLKNGRRWNFIH